MTRFLTLLAVLTAVPLSVLASLVVAGLATLRQPGALAVGAATTLLLMLPVLGISALFTNRRLGILIGANLWPVVLLIGVPVFFPGERRAAIDLGLSMLTTPLGRALPADARRTLAAAIDAALAEPASRAPLPEAAPAHTEPPPASRIDGERDQVALPYEGRGHSLVVPVGLEGPDGRVLEADMVFDTGATYTTLDLATLRALGYRPQPDAPTISFQTASGESTSAVVVIDRLWLGGFDVPGVTVALCEQCAAAGEQVGLLGLNVSSRFLITLDTARRELIVEPRSDPTHAPLDIRPWIDIASRGTRWPDGHTEVQVTGTNLADRPLTSAVVEVRCATERFEVVLGPFAPRSSLGASASIPAPADCDPFSVDLTRGAW